MIYVCVSFHPYHVCKPITYVVLMLWLLVSFSLSNDRKLFLKCKRIIVKIPMQFPLHKGLGMRPSSSLVTNALSSSSVEYIHRLESEIIQLKEQELGTKRRKLSKKRSKRIFLILAIEPHYMVWILFLMHYLKLIVLHYTWKSIFAFYKIYIRSCDFN